MNTLPVTFTMSLVDIDECGTELARCPSNTYCHNIDGSYECRGMAPSIFIDL